MKHIFPLLLSLAIVSCNGNLSFHRHQALFGLTRGGGSAKKPTTQDTPKQSDVERAERAIFEAISKVEKKMEHVVEDEVHTLFHEMEDHHKDKIKEKAKKAVKKGASKVKDQVDSKPQGYPYEVHSPFEWPTKKEGGAHKDSRILHAVEAAEHAVLHAIQDEVDTLFHETDHHHEKEATKKAKKVVEKGVKETKKKVDDVHEHRRAWLYGEGVQSSLEDYAWPMFPQLL